MLMPTCLIPSKFHLTSKGAGHESSVLKACRQNCTVEAKAPDFLEPYLLGPFEQHFTFSTSESPEYCHLAAGLA